MQNFYERNIDTRPLRSHTLNANPFSAEETLRLEIMPKPLHKKEDSTSNTQHLNESSLEISDNSGLILIEEIAELKKLFHAQEEEQVKCEEAIIQSKAGSRRMEEFLQSNKKDPTESLCDSIYKQISSFNFDETSRPAISPVPPDFDGSMFADSLMSLSDYQSIVKEIVYDGEPFLSFTSGKVKKSNFKQMLLVKSHIIGLRI